MERGRGSSFWLEPMLHPSCPINFDSNPNFVIVFKPCGFCKNWYNFYDVTLISCKHTYHLFCLAEMLKNDNKCLVCGEVFHPRWWNNFGFHERDEKLQTFTTTMKLDAL
jgi:hypothetical protein